MANLDLADSALHAPDSATKTCTPTSSREWCAHRSAARNHPLPDGNKRASWVALRHFIELNHWRWKTTPTVDDAEEFVLGIAAGDTSEAAAADWLRGRIEPDHEDGTES